MKSSVVLVCVLLLLCNVANAVKLDSLVVKERAGITSIEFSMNGPFVHKAFTLKNPDRVVVDLFQTNTAIHVNHIALGQSIIQRVRSGRTTLQTLRVVFEVKAPVSIKTTAWRPSNKWQKGLLIQLHSQSQIKTIKPQVPIKTVDNYTPYVKTAGASLVKPSRSMSYAPRKPLRDVVIVLDPGHGGKDPGARGPRHSLEKNVVLAIALKLKKLIDRQPGMHAVMTRNSDYYVGLRERLNIARRQNADIFVSIHADAFINQHSNGASVFALSPRGATSEAARWLAEKENYSELGGVNLSGLDDQSGLIRTVLLDLSQTATISASVKMGDRVLSRLDKVTTLHNSAVEQARFVVLKSPDIPSVLVETGFITNPREERNLTSSYYQDQLTKAIFEGIKGYFLDYPPHGSRLEAMSGGNLHIVRRGESLPMIASRYHVTVNALKVANRLPTLQVNPGQKLNIPMSWA